MNSRHGLHKSFPQREFEQRQDIVMCCKNFSVFFCLACPFPLAWNRTQHHHAPLSVSMSSMCSALFFKMYICIYLCCMLEWKRIAG